MICRIYWVVFNKIYLKFNQLLIRMLRKWKDIYYKIGWNWYRRTFCSAFFFDTVLVIFLVSGAEASVTTLFLADLVPSATALGFARAASAGCEYTVPESFSRRSLTWADPFPVWVAFWILLFWSFKRRSVAPTLLSVEDEIYIKYLTRIFGSLRN